MAISARPVAVTAYNTAQKVYDGSTALASNMMALGNLVGGDSVALSGNGVLASKEVGNPALAGAGSLALNNSNYTLAGATFGGVAMVSPRLVDIVAVNGASRAYDGTTALDASLLQINNIVGGDSVALSGSATLANKYAGTRAVTSLAGLSLNNSNYTLEESSTSATVSITALPLNISTSPGASRVYDGSSGVAASLLLVSNVVSGDTLTLSGSAGLAGKNVGSRALTGIGGLAIDNSNYTLAGSALSGTVAISPRVVHIVAGTADASRVCDGSTAAAAGLLRIDNLVAGDSVHLSGAATLACKDIGTRAVSSLDGLSIDDSNYTLAGATTAATVAITPRTLHLSFGVADRVFDGSTAAAASVSDDRVIGDHLGVAFGSAYADPNAASAKPVLISGLALNGGDAGNYVLARDSGSSVTGTQAQRQTVTARNEIGSSLAAAAPVSRIDFNPTPVNVVAPLPALASTFGEGAALRLVGAPAGTDVSQAVNLAQARSMLEAPGAGSGGDRDVRVPVARNSLVEIVNGGVRLPGGVDQLLFVVADPNGQASALNSRSGTDAPAGKTSTNGAPQKSDPRQ